MFETKRNYIWGIFAYQFICIYQKHILIVGCFKAGLFFFFFGLGLAAFFSCFWVLGWVSSLLGFFSLVVFLLLAGCAKLERTVSPFALGRNKNSADDSAFQLFLDWVWRSMSTLCLYPMCFFMACRENPSRSFKLVYL